MICVIRAILQLSRNSFKMNLLTSVCLVIFFSVAGIDASSNVSSRPILAENPSALLNWQDASKHCYKQGKGLPDTFEVIFFNHCMLVS